MVILEKIVLSVTQAPSTHDLQRVRGRLKDGRSWSGVRATARALGLEVHIGVIS